MNRKAQASKLMALLLVVALLFFILFMGFLLVVGSSVTNYVADIIVPEVEEINISPIANWTEISSMTITPLNSFIQNMTWMVGVLYVLSLGSVFGLAFAFRFTGSKWLAGFFIALVLILVLASIFISNIYEDFLNDEGDLAERLKEHTILSWFILYSPMIFTIIAFISGIIMFSGNPEEFV